MACYENIKWMESQAINEELNKRQRRSDGGRDTSQMWARVKYYIFCRNFSFRFFYYYSFFSSFWISVVLLLSRIFVISFVCRCLFFCSRCIYLHIFIHFIHRVQISLSFFVFPVYLFACWFVCVTTTVAQSIHSERILSTVFIFPQSSSTLCVCRRRFILLCHWSNPVALSVPTICRHFVVSHRRASVDTMQWYVQNTPSISNNSIVSLKSIDENCLRTLCITAGKYLFQT